MLKYLDRKGQYSGVVVKQRAASGSMQQIGILLRNGRVIECKSDSVAYVMPRFSESDMVKKFAKNLAFDPTAPEMPPDYPVQELARAIKEYQHQLRFQKAIAFRQLDNLYNQLENDLDQTFTLLDMSRRAFDTPSPDPVQKHMTFLHLVGENVRFMPASDWLESGRWQARPREDVDALSQLIDWIRARDPVYSSFLARARTLVQFAQNHADPKLGTFTRSDLEVGKAFMRDLSDTDKRFINFIADWVKTPKIMIESPHEVFAPTILKSLKIYDQTFIDRPLAITFLKQIGMYKPWDNLALVTHRAIAHEFYWSPKADQNAMLMTKFTDAFLKPGHVSQDSCEGLRHHFGDLPVYTIDDPTAKEIDDGVSVETAADGTWLHVHIADPTTHITPNHTLASTLQDRVQTLYLPEMHFPMMPTELSAKKFSLGATAQTLPDGSQYAMTFSARLGAQGDIEEYRVRPSLVRNVRKIFYDDLDVLLSKHADGFLPKQDESSTQGLRLVHPTLTDALLNEDELPHESTLDDVRRCENDLLAIFGLAKQHAAFRVQQGALTFMRPQCNIALDPYPLPLPALSFNEPSYATSLPAVRLSLDRFMTSAARTMVAETMIMGGRVAARFGRDTGIPLPYRVQKWRSLSNADEALKNRLCGEMRDPRTGCVPFRSMIQVMHLLPPAAIHPESGLPHVMMGLPDGYTKATSPLRRYLDMVVHWQIKAQLLGEDCHFSLDDLKQMAPKMEFREKQLQMVQNISIQYWALELLNRLQVEGNMAMMEWTCVVSHETQTMFSDLGGAMQAASATVLELGVRGRLIKLNDSLMPGDKVKARIHAIDALAGRLDLIVV
ncbi:hypothetical protein BCR43DRAFT_22059 [Syncephalastrum racemosum]|uniref:RNB domain-containing protein n=1 Tax=Syncephalastrum racemosum TaxID=13706 RepID=A0A1X2HT51_SYNRA|nr:hypothetical protein BCR43DRAFT_22059 [Syncephalastrum racemosum]